LPQEPKEDSFAGVIDLTSPNPLEFLERQQEGANSEPATEQATETVVPEAPAAPETPKPSLDDIIYPDVEGAHGLLKGKPLRFVDKQIREIEGAKQDSDRRLKEAQARIAALEVGEQMWREEFRKSQAPAPQAPAAPQASENGELSEEELELLWLTQPAKAKRYMEEITDRKIQQRFEAYREEQERAIQQQAQVQSLEEQMYHAASSAFVSAGIPKEKFALVMDTVLPWVTRQGTKWYAEGGPTKSENYLEVIGMIWPDGYPGAGRASVSQDAAPEAPTPTPIIPTPVPDSPPGAKGGAQITTPGAATNVPLAKRLKQPQYLIDQWEGAGRVLGFEGEQLERYIVGAADRLKKIQYQED
jgi:hypothetical protein